MIDRRLFCRVIIFCDTSFFGNWIGCLSKDQVKKSSRDTKQTWFQHGSQVLDLRAWELKKKETQLWLLTSKAPHVVRCLLPMLVLRESASASGCPWAWASERGRKNNSLIFTINLGLQLFGLQLFSPHKLENFVSLVFSATELAVYQKI